MSFIPVPPSFQSRARCEAGLLAKWKCLDFSNYFIGTRVKYYKVTLSLESPTQTMLTESTLFLTATNGIFTAVSLEDPTWIKYVPGQELEFQLDPVLLPEVGADQKSVDLSITLPAGYPHGFDANLVLTEQYL